MEENLNDNYNKAEKSECSENAECSENTEASSQATQTNPTENAGPKRFHRDVSKKWLGGVLAGLAQYVGNGDPLPWRIVFVLVTVFGFGLPFFVGWPLVFVYILVWAVTPGGYFVANAQQVQSEPEPARVTYVPRESRGCTHGCIFGLAIIFAVALLLMAMLFSGVFLLDKFMSRVMDEDPIINLPALFNVKVNGVSVYDDTSMLDKMDSVCVELKVDSSVIRVNVKQDKGLPPDSAVEIFPEEAL